jgi:hypothetical protein
MANHNRFSSFMALLLLLPAHGCIPTSLRRTLHQDALPPNKSPTQTLAVYEPWFGHPQHINVGYSSQDPVVIKKQIQQAKKLGITGFVVDWYGDREPFLDKSYALIQTLAVEQNFHVAMMFDEADLPDDRATDDALAAFDKFNEEHLATGAPGRKAYLEYRGQPVIFIFPKGGHTDWKRVRAEANRWKTPPLLIHEYAPGASEDIFDGFYAWINPGKKGWASDGSNWGEDYLRDFYHSMQTKYPDKIAVGAAWAGFDDRKASWGLGRYMSQRCGATFADTRKLHREYYPENSPLPFLLVATWNDYEEGSAIERGLTKCEPDSISPGN